MVSSFDSAVKRIAEVVMFENWLRFYFIVEEDEKLVLRLPGKAMEQLKKRYPSLYDLAEMLNGKEVDHATSLKEVCLFVAGGCGGKPVPEGLAEKVFESSAFQLELQLFSYWVQGHEAQLDASFMEFAGWQREYEAWKQSDEVRDHIRKLTESAALSPEGSSAVH